MDRKKALVLSVINEIIDMEDEEDEEILIYDILHTQRKRKRVCIKNYVQNVVLNYHLDDFKSHFRLNRSTFEVLLNILSPHLQNNKNITDVGKPPCDITKQLLIFIWMIANQEVFRKVSDRFDVSKSTAWKYLWKISNVLTSIANNYIKWPTGHNAIAVISDFEQKTGFPGVISSVDGTHIPICAPKLNTTSYFNRKKVYSIVLQVACNSQYMFTDCFTGYPGSVHDARLFINSNLHKTICANDNNFPNNSHMLGDSAYKNQTKPLTPYKDNGALTAEQNYYNYKEQAIGLLKGRFRCLKYLNIYNTHKIPNIIIACCVLHNICMMEDDDIDPDNDCSNDIVDNEYGDEGIRRIDERNGTNKRILITNFLYQRRNLN